MSLLDKAILVHNYIAVPPGTVAWVEEAVHPNGGWPVAAKRLLTVHAIFPPVGLWVVMPCSTEAGPAGTRIRKVRSGTVMEYPEYEIA